MKKILIPFLCLLMMAVVGCSGDDKKSGPATTEDNFIRSADISFLPEIESTGTVYYNAANQPQDMITTLKNAGCNTVRIRLWKNPANGHSGMAEVKALAQRAKQAGLKVWLTVHYSDTWADPGQQALPAEWQSLSFTDLKAAVATYTASILTQINPDIFQIGNETNNGFLWPMGKITENETQYVQLVKAASATIRSQSPNTKIMLHYAGLDADWFLGKVQSVDYDYIGLSYYPAYHGKNLTAVKNAINTFGAAYGKKVLIAETSYPFTLGYADFTNNIIGLESQIIPGISATADGQKSFLTAIKNLVKTSDYGIGFSYWGGEWIAFRGPEATNGSAYENQALYDFDHKALPALQVFSKE